MTRPRIIVDTETTSLAPDYESGSGVIWELAVIDRTRQARHLWRVKPDLAKADPAALAVGRYYERTRAMCTLCRPKRASDLANAASAADLEWSSPQALADEIAPLLDGAILVAANPAFDAGFLAAFLRAHDHAPTWHYRLRDIGSMAYGYLAKDYSPALVREGLAPEIPAIDAPTDEYALALGIDLNGFERHSALGDCELVAAMLGKIEGGPS